MGMGMGPGNGMGMQQSHAAAGGAQGSSPAAGVGGQPSGLSGSHADAMKHVLDSLSMGGGGGAGPSGQVTSPTGNGGQQPGAAQDIDPFSAFGKIPATSAGQGGQQPAGMC